MNSLILVEGEQRLACITIRKRREVEYYLEIWQSTTYELLIAANMCMHVLGEGVFHLSRTTRLA